MKEYPKINSIYKRDPKRQMLIGQFTIPEIEYLKDNIWIFYEKVDGTNIRIMWNGNQIIYGGKTDRSQIPAILVNKLQQIISPTVFLALFGNSSVCLYGEGYGAGIQKGGGNYISSWGRLYPF